MKVYEEALKKKILEKELISEEVLIEIAEEARKKNSSFFRSLLSREIVAERQVLKLAAEIMGVDFVDLNSEEISKEAVERVPAKFACHYQFMPLKIENEKLIFAANAPLDTKTQDEIELAVGFEVETVLAEKNKINEQLKAYYGLGAATVERMVSGETTEAASGEEGSAAGGGVEDIREKAEEASVVKLVNQIISDAYRKRATDIHLAPYRGGVRLRYRIDGILSDQRLPEDSKRFFSAIVSRLKIMSNLNIVERRIPQDGRALVQTEDQVLDLRVSILPTPHGESVVIRILPTQMFFNLAALGLSEKNLNVFDALLKKLNGIVLVTGPTGSGKTTTLYACLRHINSKEKKIISIEDPIEYEMENVIQVQVNSSIGLTFARGLRGMLRHDPDIMMVGEIRDKETAEIAVRVALTGHLVLSTLHTNDAPSSVARLIDIGIEPYLLASSVEAFIAQRLVRVICPRCKKEASGVESRIKQYLKKFFPQTNNHDLRFYKGEGCEKCGFTGFYGRTGVYEVLVVDNALRELIKARASASEIRQKVIKAGMKTLLQDCWSKVIKGITTVEEALRLSQDFLSEMEINSIEVEGQEGGLKKEPAQKKGTAVNNSLGQNSDEQRLHERVEREIPVYFRLLEKADGKVLKIKDQFRGGSQTKLDSFFGECFTTEDVEGVYQGVSSVTSNISEGGAIFKSGYSIPVGSILELRLQFLSISKNVDCIAKVVRVERDPPCCFYLVVCFMDLSGAERRVIKEALQNNLF